MNFSDACGEIWEAMLHAIAALAELGEGESTAL